MKYCTAAYAQIVGLTRNRNVIIWLVFLRRMNKREKERKWKDASQENLSLNTFVRNVAKNVNISFADGFYAVNSYSRAIMVLSLSASNYHLTNIRLSAETGSQLHKQIV